MIDSALERSRVVRFVRWCQNVARTVLEALKRVGSRLARYVRGSYIYRWLTTEPEPDVIVIDLRETYTVGPFIRALDRVLGALEGYYRRSRTESIVRSTSEAIRARPIRVAGIGGLVLVVTSLLVATLAGSLSTVLFAGHLALAVLSLLALRSTRSLEAVLETRSVSTLVAAFEPPEPPARANETDQPRSAKPDETSRSLEDSGDS